VAEVGNGGGAELALGALGVEAVLVQNVKDGTHVAEVVAPRARVDEDVVEEDEDKPAQERTQDVIHQCLECGRGVAQSERHDEELVEAIMRAERRLGDVFSAHEDLVVPGTEVQLREEACAEELVEEFVDDRNRVGILDRDGVEHGSRRRIARSRPACVPPALGRRTPMYCDE